MYNIKTANEVKDNKITINGNLFMVSDEVAKQIHSLCLKGMINPEKKVTEKKSEKKTVKVTEKKKNNYSSQKEIRCRRFDGNCVFTLTEKGELKMPMGSGKWYWKLASKRLFEAGYEFDSYTKTFKGGDVKKVNVVITPQDFEEYIKPHEDWWNRKK